MSNNGKSVISPEMEAMLDATRVFTEHLAQIKERLNNISEDSSSVRGYFEKADGFSSELNQMLNTISESVEGVKTVEKEAIEAMEKRQNEFIKTQINIAMLKLSGVLTALVAIITGIVKLIGV